MARRRPSGDPGTAMRWTWFRHEAVGPDPDPVAVAPFRHEGHVEEEIVRVEERPLPTVTALRDVVRQGGDDSAGHASHGDRVPPIPRLQFGRVTYGAAESGVHASWHGIAYGVPRSLVCCPCCENTRTGILVHNKCAYIP